MSLCPCPPPCKLPSAGSKRGHAACSVSTQGAQRCGSDTDHFARPAGAPWTGMLDVYDTPLPPSMIPGANAGDTECLLDEDFRDITTSHNVRRSRDSRSHSADAWPVLPRGERARDPCALACELPATLAAPHPRLTRGALEPGPSCRPGAVGHPI